ncbi:MAG: NifU N-terminal domain-containing protein [Actinobacteria bacterium]|nr:NifU N-terminal domain-containing protein [Actinomycetota bacterium]
MAELEIRVEETPNPNAKRYVLNRPVQEASKGRFFTQGDDGSEPLVGKLLALPGVMGVMLLPNSVTVNKDAGVTWDVLGPLAEEALDGYFV